MPREKLIIRKRERKPVKGPLALPLFPSTLKLTQPYDCGVLFIDFDGTLASIVEHPKDAHLFPGVKNRLRRLARNPRWLVAIVTGRRLNEIKKLVGLPNLIYVGNHGFEIQFPHQKPSIYPKALPFRKVMKQMASNIKKRLRGLAGVLLEDKIWTLSLHTRMATPQTERRAHEAFRDVIKSKLRQKIIVVKRGKKVLEVRPALPWDKGKTVLFILERLKEASLAIYIGDDNTDEDAFRVLRDRGIGIRVGHGESWARYSIESPVETPRLLDTIEKLFKNNSRSSDGLD